MKQISEIADDLGIPKDVLNLYGRYKAKIRLEALSVNSMERNRRQSKVVLVTAMTPTPSGEGKTVTAIGLSSALNRLGRKAVVCLRQPSLGPLFGIKGGAAGGGRSTIEPMNEINMHFTGDIHAVASAHNLLSSMVDNHIFQGNELKINPKAVTWKRTVDMNDRALRHITIGLSDGAKSKPRDDGFVITAASEVMAILALSRGYADLKQRLGNIVTGFNDSGMPVRAVDLKASGAMAAILKDALEPNLVQTCEETPAFVHSGPFGNIATGTCSLLSMFMSFEFADYCVVEAGFGSDLGAEKFFDIVARLGGFQVNAAVIVASIKALKYHSQQTVDTAGGVGGDEKLLGGLQNLQKHIENVRSFGIPPVVALNSFPSDTPEEAKLVIDMCKEMGVSVAISKVFEEGARGGIELAEQVVQAAEGHQSPNLPVYEYDERIEDKIGKIVKRIYGGQSPVFSPAALEDIEMIRHFGFEKLPVCMAKTPLSLSDDPKKLGRPREFSVQVNRIGVSAGAGFVIPYMGDIMTMPGLPKHPAAERIDLTESGEITGLS